jgi:hypothetical protein
VHARLAIEHQVTIDDSAVLRKVFLELVKVHRLRYVADKDLVLSYCAYIRSWDSSLRIDLVALILDFLAHQRRIGV